ncbi:MAG: hypothetical protein WD335_01950 [Candidatus Paceibacterota bacterium]
MSTSKSHSGSFYPAIVIILIWLITAIVKVFAFPDLFQITSIQMTTIAVIISVISILIMAFSIAVFAYLVSSDGNQQWVGISLATYALFSPLGIFLLGSLPIDIFSRFEELAVAYLVVIFTSTIMSAWIGYMLGKRRIIESANKHKKAGQ